MSDAGEYKEPEWVRRRRENGEVLGGGYIVFRRGNHTNRVKLHVGRKPGGGLVAVDPFEHPTLEAATQEAKRLAKKFPGDKFAVFQEVFIAPELNSEVGED